MGKLKELAIDIEEYLKAGFWPTDIARMTGIPLKLILEVEEDLYELNNPCNYGPDHD